MKTLGNIIWFIFGGFLTTLANFIAGVVLCVTIIFIPFGLKCFKMAGLSLAPFGKVVEGNFEEHPVKNALWLCFGGAADWFFYTVIGLLLCVTIIGIPFAKQNFKLAKYALRPFGSTIEKP